MNNNFNKKSIKPILPINSQLQHKKSISTTSKNIIGYSQKPLFIQQQQKTLSSQSTQDTLSLHSIPSNLQKSQSQISEQSDEFNEVNKQQQQKIINSYLGKNQMNLIFKHFSFKHLFNIRGTCKSWKLLIENYISIQTPILVSERNQLEAIIQKEMDSESTHSKYVRAYKKVSLGHDLIFNLSQSDAEKFYLLKDKSDCIKEIRSITHQIIGKNVIEKNKEIKKYSAQYYYKVISECKEVQVSDIPKDIILRMKILFQHNQSIDDESLKQISNYAYALKVLLSGYLHLYLEMNPLQSSKVRLDSIIQDLHTLRVFNKNKSMTQK